MRCSFLLEVVLLAGLSTQVQAQFSYGIKAGVNFSRETAGSHEYSTRTRIGFNAGIFAGHPIGGSFAARVECFYSEEGTREEYTPTGTEGVITRGFLRVPVLLQYALGAGTYVETGPAPGFLLSSKENFNGTVTDIKPYYSAMDLSWCFGAGCRLDRLLKGLELNARFAPRLTRLNKTAIAGGSLTPLLGSLGLLYAIPSGNR